MYGEHNGGMDCGEFEALLSDALDGILSEPKSAGFQAHAVACANCGPLLAAAQAGMSWLKALPEIEPPRNLVRNILIATSGAETAPARKAAPAEGWRDRLRAWARPLGPMYAAVRQPRFALSLGMAFFSITVLLNAAGLHLSSLRAADLRPSSIQDNLSRSYYETSGRVVKYYENIRFVYEIESRVREIRNATREQDQQQEQNTKPDKKERKYRDDNTSGRPEQKQDRYSRRNQPDVLADTFSPADHPWVGLERWTPPSEVANPILDRSDV